MYYLATEKLRSDSVLIRRERLPELAPHGGGRYRLDVRSARSLCLTSLNPTIFAAAMFMRAFDIETFFKREFPTTRSNFAPLLATRISSRRKPSTSCAYRLTMPTSLGGSFRMSPARRNTFSIVVVEISAARPFSVPMLPARNFRSWEIRYPSQTSERRCPLK